MMQYVVSCYHENLSIGEHKDQTNDHMGQLIAYKLRG